MNAATAGNEEAVKLLLDAGAELNVQDIRSYSALLYAAGSDVMPAGVVRMLLEKGADRNAKGDGETATMLAAKRGDCEVARLLGAPTEKGKRPGAAPVPGRNRRQRVHCSVGTAGLDAAREAEP